MSNFNYSGGSNVSSSDYISWSELGKNTGLTGTNVYKKKGTGHMVGVAAWEPQRTNNFEIVIEGLQTLIPAGKDPTTAAGDIAANTTEGGLINTVFDALSGNIGGNDYAERLMLSVDSFTAPAIEITPITGLMNCVILSCLQII